MAAQQFGVTLSTTDSAASIQTAMGGLTQMLDGQREPIAMELMLSLQTLLNGVMKTMTVSEVTKLAITLTNVQIKQELPVKTELVVLIEMVMGTPMLATHSPMIPANGLTAMATTVATMHPATMPIFSLTIHRNGKIPTVTATAITKVDSTAMHSRTTRTNGTTPMAMAMATISSMKITTASPKAFPMFVHWSLEIQMTLQHEVAQIQTVMALSTPLMYSQWIRSNGRMQMAMGLAIIQQSQVAMIA